jgi:hypothetical protein
VCPLRLPRCGDVVVLPFHCHERRSPNASTAYTMLLDVVIDLGVTVLLSRQVVDVGPGGVG